MIDRTLLKNLRSYILQACRTMPPAFRESRFPNGSSRPDYAFSRLPKCLMVRTIWLV